MKAFKIAGESSSVTEWGTVHSAENALGSKVNTRKKSNDRIISVLRFAEVLRFVHCGTKYLLHAFNVLFGAKLKQLARGGQLNGQKTPPGAFMELEWQKKRASRPKFYP